MAGIISQYTFTNSATCQNKGGRRLLRCFTSLKLNFPVLFLLGRPTSLRVLPPRLPRDLRTTSHQFLRRREPTPGQDRYPVNKDISGTVLRGPNPVDRSGDVTL